MTARCIVCDGVLAGQVIIYPGDEYCKGKCDNGLPRGKSPEYIIADDPNPLNPNGIKEGDRVACDHYMNFPALHGTVVEINEKGLIWVKLDIGGYKETYHPFCKKI